MQDRSAPLANPFLCPEFAQAVGRYRPSARVAVLSDGARPVGYFPFERRGLGVGMPIGAGLTDCQGMVSAPGTDWDAADLLTGCGLSAWHFDHLVSCGQPFAGYQVATAPSPVMDLTDGFAAYERRMRANSPRFWRDLGREARKLEREIGQLKLVADSRDVRDLRMLMRWKSDQYRRTGRVDRFAHPWVVAMVERLLATRGRGFRGLLSILYAGGIPIAGSFDLCYGGMLAGWFNAYDSSYARYSPGRMHLVRMAEEMTALGVRSIDMGKGRKHYKEKFKSYELTVGEGTATTRSALAWAHRLRLAPPLWAARQIRAHQRLFTLADHVLKQYGRIHTALWPGS
jgi:CelD/BcsL family acetyltransferase involved in cellulose biosynthesis